MGNPAQESLRIFNEGLELKRRGLYKEAIGKYIESIRVYPNDPEIGNTAYSLGKAYYLAGDYVNSVATYLVHWFTLIEPALLKDYHAFKDKTISGLAKGRFEQFIIKEGIYVGHSICALTDATYFRHKAVPLYKNYLNGDTKIYDDLEDLNVHCFKFGYSFLSTVLEIYERDYEQLKDICIMVLDQITTNPNDREHLDNMIRLIKSTI